MILFIEILFGLVFMLAVAVYLFGRKVAVLKAQNMQLKDDAEINVLGVKNDALEEKLKADDKIAKAAHAEYVAYAESHPAPNKPPGKE